MEQYLEEKGLLLREGTVVDATIIHAPTSTKNEKMDREPEMHQTRKGISEQVSTSGKIKEWLELCWYEEHGEELC